MKVLLMKSIQLSLWPLIRKKKIRAAVKQKLRREIKTLFRGKSKTR